MEFMHQPLSGKQYTDEDIKRMIDEYCPKTSSLVKA